MALHREIYWVGKQWAVTGYGVQACNQKQRGKFDIEGSRLWEDGLLESLRAEKWLNAEDLDKALDVARKYYPEPPRKAASSKAKAKAAGSTDSVSQGSVSIDVAPKLSAAKASSALIELPKVLAKQPPELPAQKFNMRIKGWPAKLVPVWRIRVRPGGR
jgi:hypothetical protein